MEPRERGTLLLLQQGKGEVQGKRVGVRKTFGRDNHLDGQETSRQRKRVQEETHGYVP